MVIIYIRIVWCSIYITDVGPKTLLYLLTISPSATYIC